jgi:hypothetical protein
MPCQVALHNSLHKSHNDPSQRKVLLKQANLSCARMGFVLRSRTQQAFFWHSVRLGTACEWVNLPVFDNVGGPGCTTKIRRGILERPQNLASIKAARNCPAGELFFRMSVIRNSRHTIASRQIAPEQSVPENRIPAPLCLFNNNSSRKLHAWFPAARETRFRSILLSRKI